MDYCGIQDYYSYFRFEYVSSKIIMHVRSVICAIYTCTLEELKDVGGRNLSKHEGNAWKSSSVSYQMHVTRLIRGLWNHNWYHIVYKTQPLTYMLFDGVFVEWIRSTLVCNSSFSPIKWVVFFNFVRPNCTKKSKETLSSTRFWKRKWLQNANEVIWFVGSLPNTLVIIAPPLWPNPKF